MEFYAQLGFLASHQLLQIHWCNWWALYVDVKNDFLGAFLFIIAEIWAHINDWTSKPQVENKRQFYNVA